MLLQSSMPRRVRLKPASLIQSRGGPLRITTGPAHHRDAQAAGLAWYTTRPAAGDRGAAALADMGLVAHSPSGERNRCAPRALAVAAAQRDDGQLCGVDCRAACAAGGAAFEAVVEQLFALMVGVWQLCKEQAEPNSGLLKLLTGAISSARNGEMLTDEAVGIAAAALLGEPVMIVRHADERVTAAVHFPPNAMPSPAEVAATREVTAPCALWVEREHFSVLQAQTGSGARVFGLFDGAVSMLGHGVYAADVLICAEAAVVRARDADACLRAVHGSSGVNVCAGLPPPPPSRQPVAAAARRGSSASSSSSGAGGAGGGSSSSGASSSGAGSGGVSASSSGSGGASLPPPPPPPPPPRPPPTSGSNSSGGGGGAGALAARAPPAAAATKAAGPAAPSRTREALAPRGEQAPPRPQPSTLHEVRVQNGDSAMVREAIQRSQRLQQRGQASPAADRQASAAPAARAPASAPAASKPRAAARSARRQRCALSRAEAEDTSGGGGEPVRPPRRQQSAEEEAAAYKRRCAAEQRRRDYEEEQARRRARACAEQQQARARRAATAAAAAAVAAEQAAARDAARERRRAAKAAAREQVWAACSACPEREQGTADAARLAELQSAELATLQHLLSAPVRRGGDDLLSRLQRREQRVELELQRGADGQSAVVTGPAPAAAAPALPAGERDGCAAPAGSRRAARGRRHGGQRSAGPRASSGACGAGRQRLRTRRAQIGRRAALLANDTACT
ncbi:hypothetical protein HT031_000953 [Scenedesmus sp. PABB004]|nr:hypothetical protein HT031_000953 [Scenedesmus sp. PABB004]